MKEKILKLYKKNPEYTSTKIKALLNNEVSDSYIRRVIRLEKAMNSDFGNYCQERGIDLEQVNQYWDKTKEYSVQVKPNFESDFDILEEFETLVNKYKPTERKIKAQKTNSELICQSFYSDTHVGLDPNSEAKSLYGGSWSEKDLIERANVILQNMVNDLPKEMDCLQVINLGDFADGLDKKTVRRMHDLPQNMTNSEVFDVGVRFKIILLEGIYSNFKFNKLMWYNVCNSNHSSDFDYFICQAFKATASHYENIEVINERKFIGHVIHGNHCEIISHGKDDVNLKFGFKPTLDERGYKKIDEYIKHHKLDSYFITFHKGDSHLRVEDKTNQDFDYCSYYALSPSSSWVQVNYQIGRSGFTFKIKDKYKRSGQKVMDYEFNWNSNEIK